MKITVDRSKCRGGEKLRVDRPQHFRIDEQFKAVVVDPKGDGDAEITKAAKFCPAVAILLDDEATGKRIFP